MDGQEYLNQISASNRPEQESKLKKILASKFFMVIMVGMVALMIILVLGMVLSGNKNSDQELYYKLSLHLNSTDELIKKYKPNIKSSVLRSHSVSLSSVISVTLDGIRGYIKSDGLSKTTIQNLKTESDTNRAALDSELFNAKINGMFDRVYARKMTYEVALLKSEEMQIINLTKDAGLKDSLTNSYNSLENIYRDFNNFSEANN